MRDADCCKLNWVYSVLEGGEACTRCESSLRARRLHKYSEGRLCNEGVMRVFRDKRRVYKWPLYWIRGDIFVYIEGVKKII